MDMRDCCRPSTRFWVGLGWALLVGAGCGGAPPRPTTARAPARAIVQMEEMRITARPSGDGFELHSYDAETLFTRATGLLNRRRCPDAVALYDRLADEFPTSRYRSPALYNAGLCLQDAGEGEQAVLRFDRLLREEPRSPDVKDASFQLAKLDIDLERWLPGVEIVDALLAREDLSADEREEALARRAQSLLGAGRLGEAARQARSALAFYRSRPADASVHDEFFAAAANFVLAETIRLRAERITIPQAAVEEQRALLESRAGLMLEAQRAYFDTIRLTNAHWAAASGYRIGSMYDALWRAITTAPTPPPPRTLPAGTQDVFEAEYRRALGRTIEPLIRNAVRFWELTLMMVERSGVRTEWTDRLRADLAVARRRLLGDAPASSPSPPPSPAVARPPAAAGVPPEGPAPDPETGDALSDPGAV